MAGPANPEAPCPADAAAGAAAGPDSGSGSGSGSGSAPRPGVAAEAPGEAAMAEAATGGGRAGEAPAAGEARGCEPPAAAPRAAAAPCFAVVGPSGAGKDTLIAAALALRPDLHVVRRVVTRPEQAGGEPIEGVTEAEFARRRAAGEFALDWTAHGLHYGIPASALAARAAGRTVIFNGSRAMLAQAAAVFPGLRAILITASPEVLAERLAARGREGRAQIAARLARGGEFALPADLPARRIDNDGTVAAALTAFLAALQPESA